MKTKTWVLAALMVCGWALSAQAATTTTIDEGHGDHHENTEPICDVDVQIIDGTLYRCEDGGPLPTIVCDGTTATSSWLLPEGQLALDHPELNTGGYAYFTREETPTSTLKGGQASSDFAGMLLGADVVETITVEGLTPGDTYRAHLLLAYEDGRLWHNDTRFVCEPKPVVETDTESASETITSLPFTGPEDLWLASLALALIGTGWLIIRRTTERNL